MRGTIRQRGKTYTYQFYVGFVNGKEKRVTKGGFKTKKDAEIALAQAIIDYEKNNYIEPTHILFNDVAIDYIENYIHENKKLNTYKKYLNQYNKYLKDSIGYTKIQKITTLSINNLMTSIKKQHNLSNTTMQGIYTLINSIFNRALRQRLIQYNPCAGADRPRRDEVTYEILTEEECIEVLDTLKNTYSDWLFKCAFTISVITGLRRGELAALCVEDINYASKSININSQLLYIYGHTHLENSPKTTNSARNIPLTDDICEITNDLINSIKKQQSLLSDSYIIPNFNDKEYNFLFRRKDGSHVHPMWFYNKLQRILKRTTLKKKIRWHDLRHSCATHYLHNNADIVFVSKLLGHYAPSFTHNVYCHSTNEHQYDMVKNNSMKLK